MKNKSCTNNSKP